MVLGHTLFEVIERLVRLGDAMSGPCVSRRRREGQEHRLNGGE